MEIDQRMNVLFGIGTRTEPQNNNTMVNNHGHSTDSTRTRHTSSHNVHPNSPTDNVGSTNGLNPASPENAGGGDGRTSIHSNHTEDERTDATPHPVNGAQADGPKKLWMCYVLALPPHGLFGAYNYYLGRRKMAVIYTCTFGLCAIGWIVDLIRMRHLVQRSNEHIRQKIFDPYCVDDAYLTWFPLGLLGLHRFYLGDWVIGVVFFLTLSAFSFGWWFDACFLKVLVDMSNRERDSQLAAQRAARGEPNTGYQDDEYAPPPYHTLVGLVTQRMNSTGSWVGAGQPPVVPEILVAPADPDQAFSDTDTASTPSYPVSYRTYDLSPQHQRRRSPTSSRRSSTTTAGGTELGSEAWGSRRSSRSRERTDSYVSSMLGSYSVGSHRDSSDHDMELLDVVDPADKPPEYSSLTNIPSYVEPAPPAYDTLCVPDTVVHM